MPSSVNDSNGDMGRQMEILVAAPGRPEFIQGEWIRPGAAAIHVSIDCIAGPDGKRRLVDDVAYDAAAGVAGAITPLPGGVGPIRRPIFSSALR